MAQKTEKVFTVSINGQEQFSFHAVSIEEADQKAWSYCLYHRFFPPIRCDVTEGPGKYNNLQDGWIPVR